MVINERTMSPTYLSFPVAHSTGAARSETRSHARDTYRDEQTMPRIDTRRGNSYILNTSRQRHAAPRIPSLSFQATTNLARVTHGFPLENRSSPSRVKASRESRALEYLAMVQSVIVAGSASKQREASASSLTKGKADGRRDDETSCSRRRATPVCVMVCVTWSVPRLPSFFPFFFFLFFFFPNWPRTRGMSNAWECSDGVRKLSTKSERRTVIVRVELPFSTRTTRNLAERKMRREERRRGISRIH